MWKSRLLRGRRLLPEGIVSSGATRARVMLDAWRERGADRMNPVRFRFIEALDRRAAGCSGEARRTLDERLSSLLQAYANDLERFAPEASDAGGTALRCEPARGALALLVDYVAGHARSAGVGPAGHATPRSSDHPPPDVLDYFRETWSRVSTEKLLRESRYLVPRNAGPLNSASLVHRSLSLMRELSPGYLQQFLSYVDALSWLEQLDAAGGVPSHHDDAHRAGGGRKRARSKPR